MDESGAEQGRAGSHGQTSSNGIEAIAVAVKGLPRWLDPRVASSAAISRSER